MKSASVSVVVPAYNEEDVIARLLKSIRSQSYEKIETIVIDDASTDKTAKIAKKYAIVIHRRHAERSVQRNFGANKASGKYLLFLDADMELTANVVKECVDKMKGNKKIGGIVIPEVSMATNFWERVKAYERSFYSIEGDELTDAARFFPKKMFVKIGGYDESITGPEDWELTERINKEGYNIANISSIINHYERVPSIIKLLKKKYYYGLKSHRYFKKQNIKVASPKTILFLRPVFYKNWKKLVENPLLSLSMFFMFILEMLAGGAGYIIGRLRNL